MTLSTRVVPASLALLLFLAVGFVYGPVVHHEFVYYDDYAYIVDNPRARSDGTPRELFARATQPALANWNPLTVASLQLEHAVHGLSSVGVHATNAFLHALATALLFGALLSLTGALWPSLLCAAIFGLHPAHVESVAWAAERKDVLCAVFWMTTLWSYAAWARWGGAGRYALLACSLALALLAKPMAVTLPFVLLLLDLWPLGRLQSLRELAPRVREKLPLFAMVAGISVVTYLAQDSAGAVQSVGRLDLASRVSNAATAYVAYLLDSLWPTGLGVFYPHVAPPTWRLLSAIGLLAALTAGAAAQLRRRPELLVGWLWFLGTLVPVIGLVQVGLQARADRYLYLPQVGLTLALFFPLAELPARFPRLRVPLALAGVVLVVLMGVLTRAQLAHWRDSIAMFSRAIAVAPDNYFAEAGLADALLRHGDIEQALVHYREAARLRPGWALPRAGIAGTLVRRGEFEEAVEEYQRALALDPNRARAHVGLGLALIRLRRYDDAEPHLERALEIYAALGLLGGRGGAPQFGLAEIAAARSDSAGELEHYRQGLIYAPNAPAQRVAWGQALIRAGRLAEAARAFDTAEAAGFDSPDLAAGRGLVAEREGRLVVAIAEYERALLARPDWPAIENNLAWVLATSSEPSLRDPPRALGLARSAVAATERRDPGVLDTLAAAQAANDDFDGAAATEREAVQRARELGAAGLTAELLRNLDRYEAGRGWEPAPTR